MCWDPAPPTSPLTDPPGRAERHTIYWDPWQPSPSILGPPASMIPIRQLAQHLSGQHMDNPREKDYPFNIQLTLHMINKF